jgi:glyoxylase-like metal-dependent hydrolase (beta-lactamase superfamily II)
MLDSKSRFHLALGDFVIDALSDGSGEIPYPILRDEAGPLFPDDCHPVSTLQVNAFLIRGRGHVVLVDTGSGNFMGPTMNNLPKQLEALQVPPSSIDSILMTHLHPDHAGGLLDEAGAARFENATVYVQEAELNFWDRKENFSGLSEQMKQGHQIANACLLPYRDRIETFDDKEVLPGLHSVPLYGHTPGHSGFQVDGGGNYQFLIWGDTIHLLAEQASNPDLGVVFDFDYEAARRSRRALFDRIASDGVLFSGMHMPFPPIGRLRSASGGFVFEPAEA